MVVFVDGHKCMTSIASDPGAKWMEFDGRVVPGYQVASGRGNDPRFPGGTLMMQKPFFLAAGIDLSCFHHGTMNVNIAPRQYKLLAPRVTLRSVKWHPTEAAEDFSFCNIRLLLANSFITGLVYYPHPETKPRHFQDPHVLELILPFVSGVSYGSEIRLAVPADQIFIS